MRKKIPSLLIAAALVVSAGAFAPLNAQEPPAQPAEVPAVVQIEDPFGDANTLGGDNTTLPADGGSQTDIGKVWFSHDATNFQVHVLTEAPPTATSFGFLFEVIAGEDGCLVFQGFSKGTSYVSDNLARVTDGCNGLDRLSEGTSFVFAEGPGGGGLATITVPRSYSPLFAAGSKITAPSAETRIFVGGDQVAPSGYRGVGQPIDDTKAGTDYAVVDEGTATPPEPVKPPKKPTKPGKSKGCDKGNGKKKGCKPAPPAPVACPPYAPGENGAEAELLTVTDAATEENPLVVEFEAGRGLVLGPVLGVPVPDLSTHNYRNIQVDTAGAEAGLYVKLEFEERHDYDLYLQYPDGTEADHSGDFNTAVESPRHDCGGTSCASDTTFEQIIGIRTPDCGGWTADAVAYLTPGGNVTMKLWLGEVVAEPAPPAEEG